MEEKASELLNFIKEQLILTDEVIDCLAGPFNDGMEKMSKHFPYNVDEDGEITLDNENRIILRKDGGFSINMYPYKKYKEHSWTFWERQRHVDRVMAELTSFKRNSQDIIDNLEKIIREIRETGSLSDSKDVDYIMKLDKDRFDKIHKTVGTTHFSVEYKINVLPFGSYYRGIKSPTIKIPTTYFLAKDNDGRSNLYFEKYYGFPQFPIGGRLSGISSKFFLSEDNISGRPHIGIERYNKRAIDNHEELANFNHFIKSDLVMINNKYYCPYAEGNPEVLKARPATEDEIKMFNPYFI